MAVRCLLENSEDISRRLASIETRIPSRPLSIHTEAESLLDIDNNGASRSGKHIADQMVWSQRLGLDSGVELNLQMSRVYRRAMQHHALSSSSSTHSMGSGWSVLSGISLAQISSISVLSLPVSPSEIRNPEYYLQSTPQETLTINLLNDQREKEQERAPPPVGKFCRVRMNLLPSPEDEESIFESVAATDTDVPRA